MKIKVGLFGAGDIADLHASGIKNCSSAELVGLFDIDNQKAQQKSDNYNCLSYDSAESMLKDPLIDAIIVLTPLEEHFNCDQCTQFRKACSRRKACFIKCR